jgi:hypothetical protein
MYTRAWRRLMTGFAGVLMSGTLLLGALPVAASNWTANARDVNAGAETTALEKEPIFTINSPVSQLMPITEAIAPTGW